jgi:uncharacterized protein
VGSEVTSLEAPVLEGALASRLEKNPKLLEIRNRVEKIVPADAGHDFHHTLRVARGSLRILLEESKRGDARAPSDEECDAVIASALLHDCVPVAKNSPLRKESARLCSEKAREWLIELQWDPPAMVEVIAEAVLDHSYSGGRIPRTLIGKCLQDADRLEALGALGLYRTIATGVSMGCLLFDPEDPFATGRAWDDRRFTIDHFFTKLLKLPESFQTKAARAEAFERARYLEGFIAQLKHEIL